jgi:crotonobetainyl-CoA:carnitine CoA-transferase CaiB-like acyl-CoA transferase
VIRVDSATRTFGIPGSPMMGNTAYAPVAGFGQGKRTMLLNLRVPAAREAMVKLAASCDIVIENFATGVVDRLGFGYASLRKLNPGAIVISASGFGATGPRSSYVAYGRPISYFTGLNALTGYIGGPPRELGTPYADPNCSQYIILAALAALTYRERTGRGQWVDLSQIEALVTVIAEGYLEYQVTGEEPSRRGNRDVQMAPHNIFPAQGTDRWVSIACANDAQWRALAGVIGRPELADDPRFATEQARKAHEDALEAVIADWTRIRDRFAVGYALQAAGVPAFAVMDGCDVFNDPHLSARGWTGARRDGDDPAVWLGTGLPWRMEGSVRPETLYGTPIGADTKAILATVVGLSDAEIAAMEAADALI